jgi:epsilon-lactone hydrolase
MPSAEHEMVADLLRAARADEPPEGLPLELSRANMDQLADILPMPADVDVTAADVGGVAAEWVVAAGADDDRALLYLHGGAYTRGSVRSHRSFCGRLSVDTKARVLALDYRLAPEHPYPAAVDDATAGYRWLLDEGFDPQRLVVAGDSAGGGLTAALLLALGAEGDPRPAGAVLLSPWVDLTMSGASMEERAAEDPICSPGSLARSAAWYAGGEDPACPLISPLFGDLTGLPPLLVLVGTAEVLLDDSLRFAAAADAVGVDLTLVVEAGLLHVWPLFPGVPESDAAVAQIGEWVRKRTAA